MILPGRQIVCAAVLCALVACTAKSHGGYRDTDRPIGASTRFDSAAFAGDWVIVANFGEPVAGKIRFTRPQQDQLEMSGTAVLPLSGTYRVGAPGELLPLTAGREALIVMWVDADFETAAIGTASGSFGAVIDRDGAVPADRAQAARDILTFYGWDVTSLQRAGA